MKFDLAVIGGGPGGYTAAEHAAKAGLKVVLFEGDKVGGTCLNRGCIPTKALIHSAEAYKEMKNSAILGINAENVSCDFEMMHKRKNDVVTTLRGGIEKMLKGAKVTVVKAFASVTDYDENGVKITADGEDYEADYLIVATGSVPSVPPIAGWDKDGVYTSNELLEDNGVELKSIIIIGGGVIGCECASIYLDLGCKVTIVEAMEHILPPMDKEIAQRLTMFLKKQGAQVNVSAKVSEIAGEKGDFTVKFTNKKGEECTAQAEGVLIATGRKANTEKLFQCDKMPEMFRGAIVADESGKTDCDRIYVIGDSKAKNIQLAHVAEAQAKNAVAAIMGKKMPVDMSVIPSCIYTSPEIASVGMTEDEAKAQGIAVKAKKCLTGSNGKCLIENSESGYIKTVTDAETGKLLGAQLVCPRATDMVAEFALALSQGLKTEEIAAVIHPHPTFSEMISAAC
ncbi:MAG: dihydrolipoyl dehydrogenase [Clostridia bacterium]|nr:dihydrolipoyl dehydrogenase [Clostridia bacterium]MCQ2479395.1 dihydrolipoyl dehydrogenase [Clostridia bacterium]